MATRGVHIETKIVFETRISMWTRSRRIKMQRCIVTSYVSTNDSDEASRSIAECSGQTLPQIAASLSSLPDIGEGGLGMVDISKVTTAKILEKRSSPSGVEYKCELEPLWLAADLVERTQMGRVHIRSYENGLVREGRLRTLRAGKRKHSQM
jgi:hypothetical protein